MNLTILLSDLQLPLHHNRAMSALCNMLADKGKSIDEVFQVGDFYDFESISHWVSGTLKEDGRAFQRELDRSERVLEDMNKAWPWVKTRIKGNHDDRLGKYLMGTSKGLAGLRILDYDLLTRAEDFGWATVKTPYRLAPNTKAVHGLCVRSKAGYTPHAHLDRMVGNVVHGHTHRAGLVYRTQENQTRWAMEIGCLMDRTKAGYLMDGIADWQLAFGALWWDQYGVQPELIHIEPSGSFVFDGKRYRP